MASTFTVLAAINGFLGVALGAFAAHSLAAYFSDKPRLEANFKTGVQYHFYHALALLGVAWASSQWTSSLIALAGWLFLLGIILFSGSLYGLSLTGKRWLGAITPLGGLAFLVGWILLGLGALQG
jgi:uncharacterized membrane protein YgdD (TMEM256/DUF423 family)